MSYQRVKIEKMVFGGQGLTHLSTGQTVFVWNALPGEEVEIEIIKKKKNYIEGVARNILMADPDRVAPPEPNVFLSTSPWQMMSFEAEMKYKKEIAEETYQRIGGLNLKPDDLEIVTDGNMYGYRNKMEFGFTDNSFCDNHHVTQVFRPDNQSQLKSQITNLKSKISLAFFTRGGNKKIAVANSALAHPNINSAAEYILQWINEQNIPLRSLKSLIVRSAVSEGYVKSNPLPRREGRGKGLNADAPAAINTIASIFLKDKLTFNQYPKLTNTLQGFHIFYSTHKSPASVPTELLYSEGESTLTEIINDTKLAYGLFSFFQVNPPVFEMALNDIKQHLDLNLPILDFYSGVGTIGLATTNNGQHTTLIEENPEAVSFAEQNIQINNRTNCEAICSPSEKMRDLIKSDQIIIVDPPRVGLHHKLTERLNEQKPRRIIYLSCGIDTQARDITLLAENYKVSFLKLYNFFPRTPHVEALAVLDRKI